MLRGFFSELEKLGEGDMSSLGEDVLRRMVPSSMMPQELSATERAMPTAAGLAGAIGGTMGGGALARSLGAGGWRGALVPAISGLAGGLTGLAAGKGARESMFRGRQVDTARKILEMRRRAEGGAA